MGNQQRNKQYDILVEGLDLISLQLHKKLSSLEKIQLLFSNLHSCTIQELGNLVGLGRGYLQNSIIPKIYKIYRDIPLPEKFAVLPTEKGDVYAINPEGIVINARTRRIISPSLDSTGYYRIYMQRTINGETISYSRLHRLVAENFVKNPCPDIYDVINHKDGNKLNNSVSNLEWCTHKMNNAHAIKTGLTDPNNPASIMLGEAHGRSKLTEQQVIEILTTKTHQSIAGTAREYKVSESTISNILKRRNWKHIIV